MSKNRSFLSDVKKSNSDEETQAERSRNRSYSEHRADLPQPSRSRKVVPNSNPRKLNAAVVAHLHKLELRNKKLEEEKVSLQHQLTHLLHRISSGHYEAEDAGGGSLTDVNPNQNLQSTFKQIIDELSTLTKQQQQQQSDVVRSRIGEVVRAPRAGYDYVNKRGSLVESNSMFSLPEYSSLSDAYEDICLNRNPVEDINGSDYSSNFVEEPPALGRSLQEEDKFKTVEYAKEYRREMMRPGSSTRQVPDKHRRPYTEKPSRRPFDQKRLYDSFERDILHYGSDEESESAESSSQSLSIDLDNHRLVEPQPHLSVAREKLSISGSDSTSSLGSFGPEPLPRKDKSVINNNIRSISLPTSPRPSHQVKSQDVTMKVKPKHRRESGFRGSELQFHIATQQDLLKSINKLYEFSPEVESPENNYLPEAEKHLHSSKKTGETEKGPPKVHISRRFLSVRPGGVVEFSETSSSTTQPDIPVPKYISEPSTSQLNKPGLSYSQLYSKQPHFTPFTPKPRLHIYTPTRLIPRDGNAVLELGERTGLPSSIPTHNLGRKMILDKYDHSKKPPLKFAENLNFLLNPFRSDQVCINPEYYVVDSNLQNLLTIFVGLIKCFNVYTCIASQSHLVQQTHLAKCTVIPLLTNFKLMYSAEASSSMPSESNSSTALAAIIAVSGNGSTTGDIGFSQRSKREQTLRPESLTEDGDCHLPAKMERSSIQTFSEEFGAMTHQDFIFKLSSQLKLWHQYWCVLTSEGLFLHQASQSSTHRAKRSIPFDQVASVCRARLMTPMSVNRKLTSSAFLESVGSKSQSTWRNGSAPVSRKFLHTPMDKQPPSKSYFELNLVSGKVYRLRGSTNQETSQWMIFIRQAMRALEAKRIVQTHGAQLIYQGWLKRIKGSSACWFWCRLMGSHLIYSRGPVNLEPIGYKLLKNTHIQLTRQIVATHDHGSKPSKSTASVMNESAHSTFPQLLTSSSDSDSLTPEQSITHLSRTIKVWVPNRDPVYFIAPSDEEYRNWRDHLFRVCYYSGETPQGKMDVEQALQQLHQYWVYLVKPSHRESMFHSVKSIEESLLGSISQEQSENCVRIFDHILFLSHPQIQYVQSTVHRTDVSLNILIHSSEWQTLKHIIFKHLTRLCFDFPELKDEIYLQLIKQSIMYGAGCKRVPKDAFIFPSKPKQSKRGTSLFCLRGQSEASYSRENGSLILEPQVASIPTTVDSNDRFRIAPQCSHSLKEVINEYSSSSKIMLPPLNPSASGKPDLWWPAIAIWECMCLLLPLFLPSEPVIHCLEILFRIFTEPNWPLHFGIDPSLTNLPRTDTSTIQVDYATEMSHYAAFCFDTLNKTKLSGGREFGPSAMEVAAISIRNPYTHAYPFSIPVHLPYGSNYEVLSFHGGSEIRQIVLQIMEALQFPISVAKEAVLGALYLRTVKRDVPHTSINHTRLIYLDPNWKILDVITAYELSVVEKRKSDEVMIRLDDVTVQFVFRIQIFAWKKLKHLIQEANPSLLNFLVHQLHAEILSKIYLVPINGSQFIDLVTFLCRADYYDYSELQRRQEQTFSQVIRSYFPMEWLTETASDPYSFIQTKLIVLDRWAQLCKTPLDKRISSRPDFQTERIRFETIYALFSYLRNLKNLLPSRFNCGCFVAKVQNLPEVSDEQLVWIVPQENQLNILTSLEDQTTLGTSGHSMLVCVKSIPYNSVLSYGGQKYGAFFLVYLEMTFRKSELTRWDHNIDPNLSGPKDYHESDSRSKMKQEIGVRKIKVLLKDLNAILELSSSLTFLINQKRESNQRKS